VKNKDKWYKLNSTERQKKNRLLKDNDIKKLRKQVKKVPDLLIYKCHCLSKVYLLGISVLLMFHHYCLSYTEPVSRMLSTLVISYAKVISY